MSMSTWRGSRPASRVFFEIIATTVVPKRELSELD